MIEINACSCFIAQVLCAAMLRPSDRSGTFKPDTALDEEVKTTYDRTSCVRVAVGLKHTIAAQYPLTETDAISSNQDECSVFTSLKK